MQNKNKIYEQSDGVNAWGVERVDGRDNRRSIPSRNSHLLVQDDVFNLMTWWMTKIISTVKVLDSYMHSVFASSKGGTI